jgi:hypothetical protein
MKTTDIFNSLNSKKLNETVERTFGQRLDLESFDLGKLEDVRNKLRTHLHQVKSSSGFNETVENESYLKAQWMLDTVNAEIAAREELETDETFESDFDSQHEDYDKDEYDEEGEMALTQLKTIEDAAKELGQILDSDENLPEWVQKKISMAVDYLDTARDYMKSTDEIEKEKEMNLPMRESATDKASAVVTAKTMVDRVGRWIEELAGMENDTLLNLGDTIRDEMGQEQAKAFLSSVAPAIQQALENLKQTRETLASGVRSLTGDLQPEELIGADPAAASGVDDLAAPAEPDMMNAEPEIAPEDEFAAAEPAAGEGEAGRAKRESVEFQNKLLKVLAG